MNCSDAEQLFDAYLDGELTGSLRLELDAHRLRCRRCQQTLAMMDAVEHVIASDTRTTPDLSDDFTERVMGAVAERQPVVLRRRKYRRLAATALTGLSAAAVITLAVLAPHWSGPPAPEVNINPARGESIEDMDYAALTTRIYDRIDEIDAMRVAAQNNLKGDLAGLRRLALEQTSSRDLSRAATQDPVTGFLRSLLPAKDTDAQPEPTEPDRFRL